MKNRVRALFLVLIMLLALTACGGGEGANPTDESSKETTTAPETTTPQQTDPPHSHSYLPTATKNATCTEKGYTTYTCACGDTYTSDEVEATGHDWNVATCTQEKTCKTCGATDGSATGHDWTSATCTKAKTCKTCGATEGSANGHNWKNATCTEPKTCTVCGTTSGLTAGHNFQNGKCTMCGKSDPDENHETMVWIPTNGGTKYHSKSTCSNMKDPIQVTQSEAESRGFTPCKKCH